MPETPSQPSADRRLATLAALDLGSTDVAAALDDVAAAATVMIPDAMGASVVLWNAATESYAMASTTVPGQMPAATVEGVRRRSGATRWIIDNAAPLFIEDTAGHPFGDGGMIKEYNIRSFAGIPIHAENQVMGVLYVLCQAPRTYSGDDEAVLMLLAGRAATALETASYVDELRIVGEAHRDAVFRAREDRKRSDAVARAANQLMHMSDPDRDLKIALDTIGQGLGADRLLAILLDPVTRSMTATVGGVDAGRIDLGDYDELMGGLTGWAIDHDEILVSDGPDDRESAAARERRSAHGSGAMVVAPLSFSDGTFGTLTVIRRLGRAPFSPPEVSTIGVIAAQLKLALENRRLLAENRRLALTDELTQLPNRRHLEANAQELFESAVRYDRSLAVLLVDANDFKTINDHQGHAAGDAALVAIAAALRDGARTADVVGRWGGDEFLVLLPETDRAGAVVVAERIIAAHGDAAVTLAFGVSALGPDDNNVNQLIERADASMYAAKEVGGYAVV